MRKKTVIISIILIALLIIAIVAIILFNKLNKTNKIIIWNHNWIYNNDDFASIISKKENILKNMKKVKSVKYYDEKSLKEHDDKNLLSAVDLSAFLVETNDKNFYETIPEEFYCAVGLIECFLENGVTDKEKALVRSEIEKLDKVTILSYVSEEDAFNKMKERFKDKLYLLEGYEDMFPSSFTIGVSEKYMENKDIMDDIESQLENIKNIKKITRRDETLSTISGYFKDFESKMLGDI